MLECQERSSREKKRMLLQLLTGYREEIGISDGVAMVEYIVTKAENLRSVDIQEINGKYDNKSDCCSNVSSI